MPVTEYLEQEKHEAVIDWLVSEASGTWLTIIDSMDDKEMILDSSTFFKRLLESTRLNPKKYIILTSRNAELAKRLFGAQSVTHVPFLRPLEAKRLLKASLGYVPTGQDQDSAKELTELLGYHPLAIVQMAAYQKEKSISIIEAMETLIEARYDHLRTTWQSIYADQFFIIGSIPFLRRVSKRPIQ